jgi:GT2 family glycosyltransferase
VLVSVVVTVKNEETNIRDLLDSLVTQEGPLEVLIIDSDSTDRTCEIVEDYARRFPFVHLVHKGGTRGEGRNFGVQVAHAEVVAFTDGDCIANPFWLKAIREGMKGAGVVAGKTIAIGYKPFEELERVELIYRESDVTYPSCNLAYTKEAFRAAGGFDPWFVTAEDIDLNLRAVGAGYPIAYAPDAIIYHRTRDSIHDFLRQALWNGAGRKQLTAKHGSLWGRYRPLEMVRHQATFWSLVRLSVALLGYTGERFFGRLRKPS